MGHQFHDALSDAGHHDMLHDVFVYQPGLRQVQGSRMNIWQYR